MLRPRAASSRLSSRGVALRAQTSIALAALALLTVSHARAATVAILRPAHESREMREALFRLKGELLAVGLDVVLEQRARRAGDTASPESRAWLEQLASEQGLEALLDIVGDETPTGVDVWLRDQDREHLAVTRVELLPDTDNPGESLAIHAIEVLRSSFLSEELKPPARPVTSSEPTDREPALPPAPRRRIGLELGATALTGPGGVGLAILPLLRFDFGLDRRFALHATLAGFGTRGSVEAPEGGVRVEQQFGSLGACYCPEASSTLEPIIALGAGFLHTAVEGRAAPPDVAHRAGGWSFLAEGSAGVRLSLTPRYFLTLSGHAQLAQPYVAIHVLDSVVATSGRPNLLFTITLGAWR